MLGEWEGGIINTGIALPQDPYGDGKWAGKSFKSVDEVQPMILYDDEKKRYWASEYGLARVSKIF